jgi:hypothetical protein
VAARSAHQADTGPNAIQGHTTSRGGCTLDLAENVLFVHDTRICAVSISASTRHVNISWLRRLSDVSFGVRGGSDRPKICQIWKLLGVLGETATPKLPKSHRTSTRAGALLFSLASGAKAYRIVSIAYSAPVPMSARR